MKKYVQLFLFVTLTIAACQSNAQQGSKLSPKDFETKFKATKDAQLIDVRTADEFNNGHLEGAVNLDFYAADFDQKLATLDKNKPVFVYCQAGGRSGKSATKLTKMGFKEVFDMIGGYGAYKSSH